MTTSPWVLTYDMTELGSKAFNFGSDDEEYHFQWENPPGSTVRYIVLDMDDFHDRRRNLSFSWEAYNRAAQEKRWKDDCCRRMDGNRETREPGIGGDDTNLDRA